MTAKTSGVVPFWAERACQAAEEKPILQETAKNPHYQYLHQEMIPLIVKNPG